MNPKPQRLQGIERAVRAMVKAMPDVLALQARCATQAATVNRIVGENDRFRESNTELRKMNELLRIDLRIAREQIIRLGGDLNG